MNQHARILENLVTSIILVNQDMRLVFMNPAAEMLFELSSRQTTGMLFEDFALGAKSVLTGMQRCLESGHPYTERGLSLALSDKRTITVDCTISPLTPPEQSPQLLIELRQVDHQLRVSREEQLLAQREISQALSRNLAHEIKNPLGGLRGAAQLLEQELNDSALREYTQVIIGEADRLRNLVDRMLGPNKPSARCKINLHEILERVRSLVLAETGQGIAIKQDYDPSIPTVYGDPDQLIQAILNIVRNAVQAIDGRGSIILRTRIQRQCTIGLQRYRLVAQIDIIDNGPGISEELREDIFFPTISGRTGGTGLGLSIAQSLIGQHGGLIEYTSRPGETVFTLLLPLERRHD